MTFSCRHTRDFRCEETLSTPADRDTSQLPHTWPTHLVGILGDDDEQGEDRAGSKGRGVVPLFHAPQVVLQGVEHHVRGPTVKPRVDVKSNVGVAPGATLEVHVESGVGIMKRTEAKTRSSFRMWARDFNLCLNPNLWAP